MRLNQAFCTVSFPDIFVTFSKSLRPSYKVMRFVTIWRSRGSRRLPSSVAQEVMALMVAGLLNKQIAAELGASETTVKIHRHRVMEKLGAGSLAELVRMAERGIPTQK